MSADIDKAIAEEVMRWASIFAGREVEERGFSPSTDIADAWRVVDRMRELGFDVEVWEERCKDGGKAWTASFDKDEPYTFGSGCGGESAQEVICRAALDAVRRLRNGGGD